MCGIAGIVAQHTPVDRARLTAMTDILTHRGPDGSGYWIAPNGRVGLGHRRLSILDLSPAGAQPMASASGRYTATYNGEIYNFAALRAELESEGATFRGHSDTEIMLAACERYGVVPALSRIDGMFAIAVWDEQEQSLTLIRDRVGIKPLYYSIHENELSFASELRPIIAAQGRLPAISAQALTEYLRLGYVPAPLSIFENIHKLPPGTYTTYRNGTLSTPQRYWSLTQAARASMENSFTDEREAMTTLDAALRKAVASHMVADVPLGAFLSGGIDSSTVVALMQAQSARPIKTFTIGFEEAAYNEAKHAAAVAQHLGTEHHELYITDADARAVIPTLPDMYDEPFADISQIPTFLVSKLARSQVTVSLSGDGGDELFAGYNRYVFVASFWRRLQHLPIGLRRTIGKLLASPGAATWDRVFELLSPVLPSRLKPAMAGEKIHKVARIMAASDLRELQSRLISQWMLPEHALAAPHNHATSFRDHLSADTADLPPVTQQMLWDAQTYMVDDILTKVDRASMRVGLEARVPLLDHHVVELAFRVPLSMKLLEGKGKWLLREVLAQYVPTALIERPKMGFGVPVDEWLRGPLRSWAEDYLAEERLHREGYFDTSVIRRTWQAHCDGSANHGGMLWTVLMFQLWYERMQKWV